MSLPGFLRDLLEHGRVRVSAGSPTDEDCSAADAVLVEFESRYRLEMPGTAPDLSLAVARWAAGRMYFACRSVVYRDLPAAEIQQELSLPCPLPPSPSAHYSADLTLRFLPDLIQLAGAVAAADPLLTRLRQLAAAWPLSSVGIEGVPVTSLDSMAEHRSLLQLYVDRVIQRRDFSRLADPRVRQAARAALGAAAELDPALARRLDEADGEAREEDEATREEHQEHHA